MKHVTFSINNNNTSNKKCYLCQDIQDTSDRGIFNFKHHTDINNIIISIEEKYTYIRPCICNLYYHKFCFLKKIFLEQAFSCDICHFDYNIDFKLDNNGFCKKLSKSGNICNFLIFITITALCIALIIISALISFDKIYFFWKIILIVIFSIILVLLIFFLIKFSYKINSLIIFKKIEINDENNQKSKDNKKIYNESELNINAYRDKEEENDKTHLKVLNNNNTELDDYKNNILVNSISTQEFNLSKKEFQALRFNHFLFRLVSRKSQYKGRNIVKNVETYVSKTKTLIGSENLYSDKKDINLKRFSTMFHKDSFKPKLTSYTGFHDTNKLSNTVIKVIEEADIKADKVEFSNDELTKIKFLSKNNLMRKTASKKSLNKVEKEEKQNHQENVLLIDNNNINSRPFEEFDEKFKDLEKETITNKSNHIIIFSEVNTNTSPDIVFNEYRGGNTETLKSQKDLQNQNQEKEKEKDKLNPQNTKEEIIKIEKNFKSKSSLINDNEYKMYEDEFKNPDKDHLNKTTISPILNENSFNYEFNLGTNIKYNNLNLVKHFAEDKVDNIQNIENIKIDRKNDTTNFNSKVNFSKTNNQISGINNLSNNIYTTDTYRDIKNNNRLNKINPNLKLNENLVMNFRSEDEEDSDKEVNYGSYRSKNILLNISDSNSSINQQFNHKN